MTANQLKRARQLMASAGGRARAASMTPEQRREIAKTAAQKRWHPEQEMTVDEARALLALTDDDLKLRGFDRAQILQALAE